MLTLTASGQNAVTTTTNVLLDIIKDDKTTPVLSQKIYYGTYSGPSNFEIENIFLAQGYDSEVSFRLDDTGIFLTIFIYVIIMYTYLSVKQQRANYLNLTFSSFPVL